MKRIKQLLTQAVIREAVNRNQAEMYSSLCLSQSSVRAQSNNWARNQVSQKSKHPTVSLKQLHQFSFFCLIVLNPHLSDMKGTIFWGRKGFPKEFTQLCTKRPNTMRVSVRNLFLVYFDILTNLFAKTINTALALLYSSFSKQYRLL